MGALSEGICLSEEKKMTPVASYKSLAKCAWSLETPDGTLTKAFEVSWRSSVGRVSVSKPYSARLFWRLSTYWEMLESKIA